MTKVTASRGIARRCSRMIADAHNAFRDVPGRDAAPRYQFIMSDAEKAVAEELDV